MHKDRNTHKAQRDVRMAPPNDNVVDEASRQLSEVAKRGENAYFLTFTSKNCYLTRLLVTLYF